MECWKEHFEEFLNTMPVAKPLDIPPGEELVINTDPFTREEKTKTIQKTKNGKTLGPVNIPLEALMVNPDTIAAVIYRLIQEAWELRRVP